MKILLINANPVVSRMLVLCTRDENIVLDEVKRVDAVKDSGYDVLFVNDASYTDQVDALLANKRIRKKIFISYEVESVEGFDLTIKKPFLPSQITDILESIDMSEEIEESDEVLSLDLEDLEEDVQEEELPSIFPLSVSEDKEIEEDIEIAEENAPEVLDSNEIEKIKALLDMDDEIAENEPIDDEEYEARKVKVIKEQLIADGLEIIEEDAIVEVVSTAGTESSKKVKKKQKKRKFRNNPFSKKELARIEAAVEEALENMKPKKIKKVRKGKKIEIEIQLEDKK